MSLETASKVEVSPELVEAVRTFPIRRQVRHCGTSFEVDALSIYATCPACKTKIKLRAYSAAPDLEDLIDAVLEWMTQPAAKAVAEARMKKIAADMDE
jgi:hypothetical protein